jgi:hypothetical protein
MKESLMLIIIAIVMIVYLMPARSASFETLGCLGISYADCYPDTQPKREPIAQTYTEKYYREVRTEKKEPVNLIGLPMAQELQSFPARQAEPVLIP